MLVWISSWCSMKDWQPGGREARERLEQLRGLNKKGTVWQKMKKYMWVWRFRLMWISAPSSPT